MAYINRDEFLANYPQNEVYGYIYLWTNNINNKQYVGQVVSYRLDRREYEHKNSYDNISIDKAIAKYGEENFTRAIIDVAFSKEELNEKEIKMIAKYNTFKNGYNCTTGGDTPTEISEETRRKMKENHYNINGENNPFWGKKHTEETKRKIGEASKGRKHSKETKELLSKLSKEQNGSKEMRIHKSKINGGNPFVAMNKKTKEVVGYFYSQREFTRNILSVDNKVISQSNVNNALKGKIKSVGGYILKYITWEEYEQLANL